MDISFQYNYKTSTCRTTKTEGVTTQQRYLIRDLGLPIQDKFYRTVSNLNNIRNHSSLYPWSMLVSHASCHSFMSITWFDLIFVDNIKEDVIKHKSQDSMHLSL